MGYLTTTDSAPLPPTKAEPRGSAYTGAPTSSPGGKPANREDGNPFRPQSPTVLGSENPRAWESRTFPAPARPALPPSNLELECARRLEVPPSARAARDHKKRDRLSAVPFPYPTLLPDPSR